MYAVIDMGGTNTRVVAFESLQNQTYTHVDRFVTDDAYEGQIDRLVAAIQNIQPTLIGLSIGVQLTHDGQQVDVSYTMPDYVGRPIVQDLIERTRIPVLAANDNVCAVIAESASGSLQGYDRAAYMTVSTGTGAGVRIADGDAAMAYLAQVGHHIVNPALGACVCGQVGCVQALTGGQNFLQRYGKPADQIDDPTVWGEITDMLAVAIVNLARITRVDAVCVGGGIGYHNAYIRAHLAEQVQRTSPELDIALRVPHFGLDAPLMGGALLMREDMQTRILH